MPSNNNYLNNSSISAHIHKREHSDGSILINTTLVPTGKRGGDKNK